MSENQDIKKSFKATTLFGGVQVFSILVSIVRSKIVAILIGPVGIGLVELYSSTVNLIGSFTNFSLSTSAVRDVSVAYKSGDKGKFMHMVSLFSRIVWITGLLGLIVCLLGSPLWSKLTFGNYDYTLGFVFLSVVLLLNQLKSGKTVLLQSTEHYKYIASSGIIGNVLGLLTTVPIYYFFGLKGIVPVLILGALFPFLLAHYYTKKIKFEYETVDWSDAYTEGKGLLRQGFFLSINFLLSTLIFYILRIFISNKGGVAEVGLYAAGFAMVNTYVGMVIQSMGQEYYPRISSLSMEPKEFNDAVNSQIYLSLLLLGPMAICFISFSEQLLILLYSDRFVGATVFMALAMIGVIFQAPSWCLGYAFLAKADNKVFLIYETIAKLMKLATDVTFYYLWGLNGLGLSFIVSYMYYMFQCMVVCKKRYDLSLSRQTIFLLIAYSLAGCLVFFAVQYLSLGLKIIIGTAILSITLIHSYKELDKAIGIKAFIRKKIKNKL